jgi:hypothetical protein
VDAARIAAVASLCLSLAWAGPARSLGIRYPDPVYTVTGVRYDLTGELLESTSAWSVEACERDLFDGVGLRVAGVRARAGLPADLRLVAEAAQLSTGVGAETSAWVGVRRRTRSWMLGAAVTWDGAAIDGATPAWLAGLTLHTAVWAAEGVRLGCDIDGVRLAGLEHPGADICSTVLVMIPHGVALSSVLVVDRADGAHARVATALRLGSAALLVGGYDDGTGSLSLALAVTGAGARVSAGSSLHPVLGLSRGVSVGWGR